MKRRIQNSCRGLVYCDDTSNLYEAKVTFLHRTCVEYILDTEVFSQMKAKADRNLIGDPQVSLMAMALRLLKTDPQEKPPFLVASLERASEDDIGEDDVGCNVVWTFFIRAKFAEHTTGSAQILFVDELDRLCSLLRQEWASLYYMLRRDELQLDWHTDVLCLAVFFGLRLYVSQAIEKEGQKFFQRTGRPLLYYAFDGGNIHPNQGEVAQLLLEKGADPNQTFEQSTPWIFCIFNPATSAVFYTWKSKTLSLMLSCGASICQRVLRDGSDWWKGRKTPEHYTTAFHIALTTLEWLTKVRMMTLIRLLLDHCENYDVVDSDGVGIAEWADTAQNYSDKDTPRDSWIGDFIRAEIAARTTRKRHHSRVEVAVTTEAKEAQKRLKGVEHSGT